MFPQVGPLPGKLCRFQRVARRYRRGFATFPGRGEAARRPGGPSGAGGAAAPPPRRWTVTSADVRAAATALVVTERTVWRWVNDPAPDRTPRARYELTEADRNDYADWTGNVAALWRARAAKGEAVVPLRTLQRAFSRELSPGERAAVVDGVEGRRRHEVYLRWEPVARNARWEADHKELPVLVTPPRGTRPRKPWVTLFLDCYSRLIMGWALSLRPDCATVLAALRRGLVVDPERGPFGGVPRVLVPDNGLEFATTALERVCGVLGTTLDPTDAYAAPQGQDREGQSDSGPGVPVRAAVLHPRRSGRGRAAVRAGRGADEPGAAQPPLRRVGGGLQHRPGAQRAGRADPAGPVVRGRGPVA